jgi:ABC-type antimicrobial peptide transport system permease subunit
MRIAVRASGDTTALAGALRTAVAKRDRGLALTDISTMDGVISRSLEGFSLRAGAVVLFGSAALVLAMLGVYGVLAFAVNQRQREIGLRMVIGASGPGVVRWVLARGLWPVAAGLVVGLAGAVAAGRFVRDLLFGVEPTDGATLAGVTICLVVAALAACLLPAWRAVRVDPAVALRAE